MKRNLHDNYLKGFNIKVVSSLILFAPNQKTLLSCGYAYNSQFNIVLFIYYTLYFCIVHVLGGMSVGQLSAIVHARRPTEDFSSHS